MDTDRRIAVAAALLAMAAVFVYKTLADAIFLGKFGVEYVPHFYVAQAAALISTSALYSKLLERGRSLRSDVPVLVLAALAGAAAPFSEGAGDWAIFSASLAVITLSGLAQLAVWNAATSVVSGRRSRSFLPIVGAAATVGAVLGGFGSSAIVAVLGTSALGPVGALLTALTLALRVVLAVRRERPRRPRWRVDSVARRETAESLSANRHRLVVLLALATVFEALLTQFIDFGFKRSVTRNFADKEAIALFFSLFYGGRQRRPSRDSAGRGVVATRHPLAAPLALARARGARPRLGGLAGLAAYRRGLSGTRPRDDPQVCDRPPFSRGRPRPLERA